MSKREIRLAYTLIRVAALDDRVRALVTKYPKINESVIRGLSKIDPSGEKGSYLEWLVRQVSSRDLIWPEDGERVKQALLIYDKAKRLPRVIKENDISPDINKYSFHDLESVSDKLSGVELKSQRQTDEESKTEGAKVIYEEGDYKVIQIGGVGVDLEKASQAACLYAKNTKWCTSQASSNKDYLNKGPLFIVFEKGVKVAQADFGGYQVMNVLDRPLSMKEKSHVYHILFTLKVISAPMYFLLCSIHLGISIPGLREVVKHDSKAAMQYAVDVLKDRRFVEAEQYIMRDPEVAAEYAINILQRRWPEAEPYILKNVDAALQYCLDFGMSRWEAIESDVLKSSWNTFNYATGVLDARWPEGEPVMRENPLVWKAYTEFLSGKKDDSQ